MKSPILGGASVARSLNAADNQLINLFLELIDGKDGKEPGYFQMAPGLDLLTTLGSGPVRGAHTLNGVIYAVSGSSVYAVQAGWVVTLIGTIGTSSGPVSMIQNGKQLAIFDGVNGYLVPGGYPLTGGTINVAGTLYSDGDEITLQMGSLTTGGTGHQSATAVITVTTDGSGHVVSFVVTNAGAFLGPTFAFTQQSTTGTGSGIEIINPTWGTFQGIYTIPLPFQQAGQVYYPLSASYQDGFGLVSVAGTNQFYQSNLYDLSIWGALNFSSADAKPDHIMAMAELAREQWIIKQGNLEVWANAGLSGFAFQRIQGIFPETGCAATFSVVRVGDVLIWLSQSSQGAPSVVMTHGYAVAPISPQWLDNRIAGYAAISDAQGYSYLQSGHLFYVITFPTANETWAYDLTASKMLGGPVWHQRAAFSAGLFNRHWSNCLITAASSTIDANVAPLQLVGDFSLPVGGPILSASIVGLCGMATTMKGFIFSGWWSGDGGWQFNNNNDASSSGIIEIQCQATLGADPSQVVFQFTITLKDGSGSTIVTNAVYIAGYTAPFILYQQRNNALISVDITTKTIQVYVNGIALSNTGGTQVWSAATAFVNAPGWKIGAIAHAGVGQKYESFLGDVFFAPTTTLYDLSVAANRAKFIDSNGNPVSLGTTGSGPTGAQPPIFLHATTGVPASFATNNGSGGAWTINNGPLSVETPGFSFNALAPSGPPISVVGDYLTGNLYQFDLDTPTDNGTQRKWLRSWRALQKPHYAPMRFDQLAIDMETGLEVPAGTNPQAMLRWSDDGGHTWSNIHTAAVGPTGATSKRVMFKRLGSTRRLTGLDRIFELSSTDPFKVAILGAEINP